MEALGDTTTPGTGPTGQLSRVARPAVGPFTDFLYDGRGFLTKAAGEIPAESTTAAASLLPRDEPQAPPSALIFSDDFETGDTCRWSLTVGSSQPLTCPTPIPVATHAIYSSDGLLHHLRHDGTSEETFVFYFAGRPLAQLVRDGDPESDTYHWLATDHLGAPIAKIVRGTTTTLPWVGGFEPFGADWQAGTPQGASENGVLLRFPGQWVDEAWQESGLGAQVFYNVHRWYERQAGRYTRVDPLLSPSSLASDSQSPEDRLVADHLSLPAYLYAEGAPTRYVDELGLVAFGPFQSCVVTGDVISASEPAGEGNVATPLGRYHYQRRRITGRICYFRCYCDRKDNCPKIPCLNPFCPRDHGVNIRIRLFDKKGVRPCRTFIPQALKRGQCPLL